MIYSIEKIARILDGKLIGDGNVSINMLSKIDEGTKGSLSFFANKKYEEFLYNTKASAVIVSSDINIDYSRISTNLIIVDDAYQGFATMLQTFSESRNNIEGVHKHSSIEESATIGKKCYVGSNVYISENVIIGDNVKIYPNCFIGENTSIDDNTILYARNIGNFYTFKK